MEKNFTVARNASHAAAHKLLPQSPEDLRNWEDYHACQAHLMFWVHFARFHGVTESSVDNAGAAPLLEWHNEIHGIDALSPGKYASLP